MVEFGLKLKHLWLQGSMSHLRPMPLFCPSWRPGVELNSSITTQTQPSTRTWLKWRADQLLLKSLPWLTLFTFTLTWIQPSPSWALVFLSSNHALHLGKVLFYNTDHAQLLGQEQAFSLSNRPLLAHWQTCAERRKNLTHSMGTFPAEVEQRDALGFSFQLIL